MTEADNDCSGRQKFMQDWVAEYNWEATTVVSGIRDSGVAMMVATVKDGGSSQQW
jgi:hypothetical protein